MLDQVTVSLLKLQVDAINLRVSHLLVEIVGQRHIKSGRAKPNPNSDKMVSRMLAYCRCVHVHVYEQWQARPHDAGHLPSCIFIALG